MARNGGEIDASLGLELTGFRRGLQLAAREVQSFGRQFSSAFRQVSQELKNVDNGLKNTRNNLKDFERIVGGIVLAQGFYGMKSAIEDAAASLVTFMNDMQRAQIAMEYFLASPEQATAFIQDMNDFAATTAFNTTQALNLSRKLMAAQFAPRDVRGVMEILNDASAASGGTPEQMDRIVLALTQIKTNGKLAGQEMRQLAEAGIPIYKILQEQLGLTGEELMNVGDLAIRGDVAVNAILTGLQQRYEGAAKRIADTVPGMWETIKDDSKMLGAEVFEAPYKALEGFLRDWRDMWEEARNLMNEGGLGKVLNDMVPPEVHTALRNITGSIKSLGNSLKILGEAVKPVVNVFLGMFINALGLVTPIIAGLVRLIANIAKVTVETVPGIKYLAGAIMFLLVAKGVAGVMLFFWNVLRIGTVASVVAQSVVTLAKAIRILTVATLRSPVGIVIALAGALLYVSGAAKVAFGWLENLMEKLAQLGGFEFESQLKEVSKELANVEDFESSMGQIEDAHEDSVDKMKEKSKELNDFLASFDEVYQVPDDKGKDDDDDGGGAGAPLDLGVEVPDLDTDDFFPDEIELPKFTWPEMEPPEWWIALTKPLDINFKFNWPKPPNNFPWQGAVVTSWEAILRTLGQRTRQVLEPVMQSIPKWIPELPPLRVPGIVLPQLQPLTIPGVVIPTLLQDLEVIKTSLRAAWDAAWASLPIPNLETVLAGVTVILETGMEGAKQVITDTFGTAWDNAYQSVQDFSTDLVTSLAGIGLSLQTNLEDFKLKTSIAFTTMSEAVKRGWDVAWEATKTFLSDVGSRLKENYDSWMLDWDEFWWLIATGVAVVFNWIGETMGTWVKNTKKFFQDLFTDGKTQLNGFSTGFKDGFKGMFDSVITFGSDFWTDIKGFFADGYKELTDGWNTLKTDTISTVTGMWNTVTSKFSTSFNDIITKIGKWLVDMFVEFAKIEPGFVDYIKAMPDRFFEVTDKIIGDIPKVISNILKPFKELPDAMYDAIKSIPDKFREIFGKIKVPSFKTVSDGVKTTFTRIADMAGFADGGIIDKDSIVRVGEKGKREAIIPLQNEAGMQPFVASVVNGILRSGVLQQQPQAQTSTSGNAEDLRPLYVGTLIADNRGLRELERKMRVIRQQEDRRGGLLT